MALAIIVAFNIRQDHIEKDIDFATSTYKIS